jgi:hypothetical protein
MKQVYYVSEDVSILNICEFASARQFLPGAKAAKGLLAVFLLNCIRITF